jgi:hypothetical protein
MSELKTKVNDLSVTGFINEIENKQQKDDCLLLLEIFEQITKKKAKMW